MWPLGRAQLQADPAPPEVEQAVLRGGRVWAYGSPPAVRAHRRECAAAVRGGSVPPAARSPVAPERRDEAAQQAEVTQDGAAEQ